MKKIPLIYNGDFSPNGFFGDIELNAAGEASLAMLPDIPDKLFRIRPHYALDLKSGERELLALSIDIFPAVKSDEAPK